MWLADTSAYPQCALCLQSGPFCYYTTASASPATTTIIPTTTAVSTTVKSSVLVGNKQKLNKYWKQRWNIYLINNVLQMSLTGFVYMVCWYIDLEICLLSTLPPLPSVCLASSRLHHLTNGSFWLFLSVEHNWKCSWSRFEFVSFPTPFFFFFLTTVKSRKTEFHKTKN